jgi:hypothetical protein
LELTLRFLTTFLSVIAMVAQQKSKLKVGPVIKALKKPSANAVAFTANANAAADKLMYPRYKLPKAMSTKPTASASNLTTKNLEKHTDQHSALIKKNFATAEAAQLAVDKLPENEKQLLWKKFEQSRKSEQEQEAYKAQTSGSMYAYSCLLYSC